MCVWCGMYMHYMPASAHGWSSGVAIKGGSKHPYLVYGAELESSTRRACSFH